MFALIIFMQRSQHEKGSGLFKIVSKRFYYTSWIFRLTWKVSFLMRVPSEPNRHWRHISSTNLFQFVSIWLIDVRVIGFWLCLKVVCWELFHFTWYDFHFVFAPDRNFLCILLLQISTISDDKSYFCISNVLKTAKEAADALQENWKFSLMLFMMAYVDFVTRFSEINYTKKVILWRWKMQFSLR